jgi:hypothetical protein
MQYMPPKHLALSELRGVAKQQTLLLKFKMIGLGHHLLPGTWLFTKEGTLNSQTAVETTY